MARNRTISQNIAVLSGPAPATGAHGSNLKQVWAVNSLGWDANITKEDVIIYGQGAPLGREANDPPEVNLNLSYYITSAYNEINTLGFNLGGTSSALASILAGGSDRNLFVFVAPEGSDAQQLNGASSNIRVYGFGNMFLSSYSLEASVGNFPTASVQYQGLNLKTYTGAVNQPIPAIDPTTGLEIGTGITTFTIPTITNLATGNTTGIARTVLKQGDVTVTLGNAGAPFMDYNTTCVQSASLSFDLNLQATNCLGSRFTSSRDISFPINITFEVEMLAKDVVTGSLAQYFCDTGTYNAEVNMRLPTCGASTGTVALGYKLRNISWESTNWNTSAGSDPQTVTTTWIGQIGGSGDTTNGFYMSGTT